MDAAANRNATAGVFERLEDLNRIGIALSKERNIERLLEAILVAAKTITDADGGTLYRMTDDGRRLRFEIFRNDSLGIAMGGTTGVRIPYAPLELFDSSGSPVQSMVAAYAVHHNCSVNIADAYAKRGFDFSGTKTFDCQTGYRSQSFLTVPMKNHEDDVIGVLQLINAQRTDARTVVPFSEADQRMVESLASQAAIALTNRLLINHLEQLFESFVGLINTAIDDKSPYTGAHCERVPALTMMLADAVTRCHVGPLKGLTMTDRDRYELKLAGLLHDCGKVTTPVHVVDKATKLQTIFDRIDLVDTRFEVVKRDLELEMLRGALPDVAGRLAQIEEDRAFLRRVNIGAENMSDADMARVRTVAESYTWRCPDGVSRDILTPDEVTNLTVRAGTLTEAERRIINHHIDITIRMLEALPWPKHLANVPAYAGAHHERMDGKGYPRGLTRDQMPWQARCIAIADIFEALTAKDRPYKKGKTLSESVAILGKLKLAGHLDPDLFDVFMWQRVYETYAREFLDPEQIDPVDVQRVPGYSPPPEH